MPKHPYRGLQSLLGVFVNVSKESYMTLSEFIKDLQKELVELGDGEIKFQTSDRQDLVWLSIYDSKGVICLDVGDSGE